MSSRSSLPALPTNSSSNSPSTPTTKLPRSNSTGLDLLASPTRERGNDHPYGIISTSSALLTRSNSSSSGAHSPAAGKNWTRGHQSSRSLSSINTNDTSSPMPFPLSPSLPSVSSSPSRPSSNLKRSGTLPNLFPPTRPSTEPTTQATRSGDVRSWTHQELVGWMREKLKEEGVAEVVVGDIVKWLERASGGGSTRARRISGMGMDGREFLKGDTGNWSTASPPPFLPLLLSLSKRLRRSNLKSRILSGNQREISDTSLSQHGKEGSTLFEEDENAELSSEEDARGVKGLVRGWEERSSASEAGSEDEDGMGLSGGGGRRRNLSTASNGPRGSLPGLVRKRAESMNDLTFGSPSTSSPALLPERALLPTSPSFDTSPPPQQDSLVESPPLSPSFSIGLDDAKVDLVGTSPPILESLDMQPSASSTSSGALTQDSSPPPPPYRFPPTSTFETKPLPTPPLDSIPARPISTYSEDEESPHLSNMSHLVRTGSNPYGALRRASGGPNKPGYKPSKEEQDASNSGPRPPRPSPSNDATVADEGDDEEEMFEGKRWNEGGGTMRRVTARPRSKIIDPAVVEPEREEVLVVASPPPKHQPTLVVEPKQPQEKEEEDQISLMRTMMGSMSERITVLEGRLEELLLVAASPPPSSAISTTPTAPPLLTPTTITTSSHSSTDELTEEATAPAPTRRRKGTSQRIDPDDEDASSSPSSSSRRPERDMHYVLLASMGVGIIFLEIVWRKMSRGRA